MSDLGLRLDRMRFGGFHRRLLAMGGAGYMFDAMDVGIIGFVLPVIIVEWGLSGTQAGIVAGSSAIGGIVGALLAGRLGDVLGRRVVMMWSLAIYALATLVSAVAWSFDSFLISRIVAGIGTSAESVIIAPFLAEFAPARLRGRFIGSLTAFFAFGFIASAVIGWLVVPATDSGWRWALTITALPIVLLLWWRRSLPESPRWLERQGRGDEAKAIVDAIERECGSLDPEHPAPAPHARVTNRVSISALVVAPLRNRLALTLVLWGVMGCCYYAFLTWIPALLMSRGLTMSTSFGFTIAIYGAQVPGFLSAAWANDRIGRRNVVALYMGLGAIGALFLSAVQTPIGLLVASMALSFALNGAYAGLYSYTPELFPTSVRATAQGLATATSRIGAMISPILVGMLYPTFGFVGVFATALVLLLTGMMCALFFGPRTNNLAFE